MNGEEQAKTENYKLVEESQKDKLLDRRARLQASVDRINQALSILNTHPEFEEFLKIVNSCQRIY